MNPYQAGGSRYWSKIIHSSAGIAICIYDGEFSSTEPLLLISGNEVAWERIVELMTNPPSLEVGLLLPVATWADWKAWQASGELPLGTTIDRKIESNGSD